MYIKYDLYDSTGNPIELGLNSREEAWEYAEQKQLTDYSIVERQVYTVTGLGRDPHLH